jgi:hypothetical protein
VRATYVGCSGNFTVERTLQRLNRFELHGNDVTLYSCAIGSLSTGDLLTVGVKPAYADEWGWLSSYLETPEDVAATMMVASTMLGGLGRNNPYFERIRGVYVEKWKELHAAAREKVERLSVPLKSFHIGDAVDWADTVPDDAAMVSFPPFYCLAPDERILTADLRWVPCGDLEVGDRLLAFDEEPPTGARCRRWRWATVTRSELTMKTCVRVHLEDGTSIVCTDDHPWLARFYSAGAKFGWVAADRMVGKYATRLLDTWVPKQSFESGWLSGLLDGEGSIALGNAPKFGISQKPGPTADRFVGRMAFHGFQVAERPRPSGVSGYEMVGGFPETLRAMGTLRPERLIERFQGLDVGRLSTRSWGDSRVKVLAVEVLGKREIQSISTSTGTYVGEGFAMHNTAGYEIMFKGLSEVFSWPSPDYPPMNEERRQLFIDRLMSKKAWFVGTNYELPGCDEWYSGYVKTTPRAMPVFVYSSQAEDTRIVLPRQLTAPVKAPYLGEEEELGERMSLAVLKAKEFAALRSAFLNPKIAVATGLGGYAVVVDGKIIGAFAISIQSSFMGAALAAKVQQPHCYLLSDFAIRPTRYRNLSKLVLMAALSHEAKLLFEREGNRRFRSVVTTAFTDNAVSMKYRGLFRLISRAETEPNDEFTYKLNYAAELGQWSLDEALAQWRAKYGKETIAA